MTAVEKKVIPFPQTPVRRRDYELAFLPAALEITETPPSPTRRAVGLTIIALFCLALAWASLGATDIVAIAPGKIVPSGRTKLIQPFETGVVRAIHIQDGQSVKAGDVLIELDPTMSDAELGHLKSDLLTTHLDVARLRAALSERADPLDDFHPPAGASPTLIEMQRQFLISQNKEQNAKLAEIDRQLAQKEAERATISATIAKLNATIPLLQQRVDVRKVLYDKELGSKLTYLTELGDLVGQQQDLLVQQSRYREADAAVAALAETRAKIQSDTAAAFSMSLRRLSKRPVDLHKMS
jgi:hemolysin D